MNESYDRDIHHQEQAWGIAVASEEFDRLIQTQEIGKFFLKKTPLVFQVELLLQVHLLHRVDQ